MVLFSSLVVINTMTKSNLEATGMGVWPSRQGNMSFIGQYKWSLDCWVAQASTQPLHPQGCPACLGHGVIAAVVSPSAAHPAGGRGAPAAAHGLCVGTKYQVPVTSSVVIKGGTVYNYLELSQIMTPTHAAKKTTLTLSNKRTSKERVG